MRGFARNTQIPVIGKYAAILIEKGHLRTLGQLLLPRYNCKKCRAFINFIEHRCIERVNLKQGGTLSKQA